MKESVTKFDLESAFKALDEIDIPVVEKGIRANKPALTEIFSRKSKFDALFEEYYDINSTEGLDDAKAAREAEVAKAKLDRIEKIVDLDADSPEDLLTSYVGKYIMQCPQCMTLFYKDKEDIVESEDDPSTVNVNEVCQHCGNESGYTLVGKVGEAEAEESEDLDLETMAAEEPTDELPAEETSEEATEEADNLDFDLDAIDLDEEEVETEEAKKEEAFTAHESEALVEELAEETNLDAKLKAHNEYIEYLRVTISQEEAAQEKTDNEQVKAAIQRRIDALKADLESALPDAVKNEQTLPEETAEEISVESEEPEVQEEAYSVAEEAKTLTEMLHEEADLDVSAADFEDLINSPEFQKPISDTAVRAMLSAEAKESDAKATNEALEEGIFDKLKDKFADVVDTVTSKLKSREAKADWILANALEDYNSIKIDNSGKLVPDEQKRKFHTFIVIGFKENYSNGKKITMAPSFNNKDLEVGKNGIQVKKNYKNADDIAKGWSMSQGNGPAFIYLAKDKDDDKAVFLCEYFKGELEQDQLEKYFDVVKKDLKAGKLMARGGIGQTEDEEAEDTTVESLNTIMSNLDELQEELLEKRISNSLIEAYQNIAGFRLTGCTYLNEQLTVDGTIFFTSGRTRQTSYAFSEATSTKNGKIMFYGLNEKLGSDKRFTLTGHADSATKTFITESFKSAKR